MKRKKTVGLPRSLIYYRDGVLLKTFINNLKCKVIIPPLQETINKDINICIPYQKYLDDIEYLNDKCDYIITTSIYDYGQRNKVCPYLRKSINILTKRQILEYKIEYTKAHFICISLFKIGIKLSKNILRIIYAYVKAIKKQRNYNINKENYQKHLIEKNTKKILIISNYYILEDTDLIKSILNILKDNKIIPILSCNINKKTAMKFSKYYEEDLGNKYYKEMIGAYYYYIHNVSGIIYISSKKCEIDNLLKNLSVFKNCKIPIKNIDLNEDTETKTKEFIKKII